MSGTIKKILEEQEKFRNLIKPHDQLTQSFKSIQDPISVSTAYKAIQKIEDWQKLLSSVSNSFSIKNEMDNIERQRQLLLGPIEEMRRLGFIDGNTPFQSEIDKILEDQARFRQQFRLPQPLELSAFAHIAMASDLTHTVMATEEKLKECFAEIRSPWVQIEEVNKSVVALSELVSIGRGIDIYPAYDQSLVCKLRSEFGDWRDVTMPPPEVLTNPILRTEFYRGQGFNFDLTHFTSPAFYESLRVGGLVSDDQSESLDDDGFGRNKEAHEVLHRFENAVRRFIEKVMREEFGPNWIVQRLPSGMYDSWQEKKQKAIKAGKPEFPLIDYADFTDYKAIIEKNENWNQVFKGIFGRKGDVQESFQRLFPIRISYAHARPITLEDALLLRVETKRILKAIGVVK
ncbi:Swt1 family HEPN domain-containing protein [Undibacterium luofuense]|uniref:Swt1-like HEPN domain-containing protein n=1 Tax=Undibacterium luofuense TaxID=2828733 RepID=A0A941I8B1_9BURK|nr:Swt1 family HEPN domain-containing protein [Undibacterium luofuense]MBR7782678.1 hypothetical protein [Undibacterium luofuense]